jgi:hypothetical protein
LKNDQEVFMADEEKKDERKQELAKVDEQSKSGGLTLDQVMSHPAVQQLSQRLEETKQLLQSLPEAIGRAVAEAQRAGRVPLVSGPAVELRPSGNGSVEFHRKGRIIENGKEIVPEGMRAEGTVEQDLEDIRRKAPPRKLKR